MQQRPPAGFLKLRLSTQLLPRVSDTSEKEPAAACAPAVDPPVLVENQDASENEAHDRNVTTATPEPPRRRLPSRTSKVAAVAQISEHYAPPLTKASMPPSPAPVIDADAMDVENATPTPPANVQVSHSPSSPEPATATRSLGKRKRACSGARQPASRATKRQRTTREAQHKERDSDSDASETQEFTPKIKSESETQRPATRRGRGLKPEKVLQRVEDAKISEYTSHGIQDLIRKLQKFVVCTGTHVMLSVRFNTNRIATFTHGNVPLHIQHFVNALQYRESSALGEKPECMTKHSNIYGQDRTIHHYGNCSMHPHPPMPYTRNGKSGMVHVDYSNVSAPDALHARDVERLAPRYARMILMLHRHMRKRGYQLTPEEVAAAHRQMLGDKCTEFAPGMFIRNTLSVPLSKSVVDELATGHRTEFGRSMLQELSTPVQNEDVEVRMARWAESLGQDAQFAQLVAGDIRDFFKTRRCVDKHERAFPEEYDNDADQWLEDATFFAPSFSSAADKQRRRERLARHALRARRRRKMDRRRRRNASSSQDESSNEDSSKGGSSSSSAESGSESDSSGSGSSDSDSSAAESSSDSSDSESGAEQLLSAEGSDADSDLKYCGPPMPRSTYAKAAQSGTADEIYRMPACAEGPTLEEMLHAQLQEMGPWDDSLDAESPPRDDTQHSLLEKMERAVVQKKGELTRSSTAELDALLDTSELDRDMENLRRRREATKPLPLTPQLFEGITNEFVKVEQQWSRCKKTATEISKGL